MVIKTDSYAEISRAYSETLAWMKSIGVQIGAGRTQHYKKVLEYWAQNYKTASDEDASNIFTDFVYSRLEINDFIKVYEAFKSTPVSKLSGVISTLQKAVNGPINTVDESSDSTTARNFLFEALMMAKAHQPENGVEAILSASTDAGLLIDNHKIWIECKRVSNTKKLESNARKAANQLQKQLKEQTGAGHRGIVAFDVSKILQPGDKLWVAQDNDELTRSIDQNMDHFIHENSLKWQSVYGRKNRKIIGTFIRFAYMAVSEERQLLVHASQWGVNPNVGISPSDMRTLKRIALALQSE